MYPFSNRVCIICRCDFEQKSDKVSVTSKGLVTITKFCELYHDTELSEYLASGPSDIYVHETCRKKFTDKRKYEISLNEDASPSKKPREALRSSTDRPFSWKTDCCLCGQLVVRDDRHPDKKSYRCVKTLEIKDTLKYVCSNRQDDWSVEVMSRLEMCTDLVAPEAVYHKVCHDSFLQGRDKRDENVKVSSSNTTVDVEKMAIFEQVCEWLETNDGELHTLQEFHTRMVDISGVVDKVYSVKHLRRKLEEKYGSHIQFSTSPGKNTVICFTDLASTILNDKWYSERNDNAEDDSERIVIAAANLIKAKIRQTLYTTHSYPVNDLIGDQEAAMNWIPDLLLTFMHTLIGHDLKETALSHCIVQAVRPRSVLSPVLCGVAISLDHMFGSKFLLSTLSRLGLSLSWDEVYRYRQNVAMSDDMIDLPKEFPHFFTQFSGDNVDHNLSTLDGKGTFHGMGIIAMSVPFSRSTSSLIQPDMPVKRLPRVKASQVSKGNCVPLLQYDSAETAALSKLKFDPLTTLNLVHIQKPSLDLDLIWHVGSMFADTQQSRPGWRGFMQSVSTSPDFPSVADIRMLPIIDRNPNDMSTIYSTLRYIQDQAERLKMDPVVVTFDQPLWLKAVEIVHTKSLNIVCRLGGFNVLMSFLGSIGNIMAGSGLQEAFQCCYGSNAVLHMLTGKAYDRAIRAHFMTESALYTLLVRHIFCNLDSQAYGDLSSNDVEDLQSLFREVSEGNVTPDRDLLCLKKLQGAIDQLKNELSTTSRTAKLWFQYLYYVQVLKTFIRAERTSDWNLHLYATSQMLNLFAAAGHTHYAKCARFYLQMMSRLPQTHPRLYNIFADCNMHSVRRTDRYWAGISTDLAIEQVMMKSLKSRGGLTHGRGLTESVRVMWVQSMHNCAAVHSALMRLTNMETCPEETRHREVGVSRVKQDFEDMSKTITWFENHNPFAVGDGALHSLASGVAASESDGINCDDAETVGQAIMTKFDNCPYSEVVLRKADRVKPLSNLLNKMTAAKKHFQIDPNVLFTRLLFILQRQDRVGENENSSIENYFSFELTPLPCSLFIDGCLRKANKSLLAHHFHNLSHSTDAPVADTFVIDGGYLLHKVKWKAGTTYGAVLEQYTSYVQHHFRSGVTVVFDGYGNGPSIKDHEHMRRARHSSPAVVFNESTITFNDQQSFLANEVNKVKFLLLLKVKLLSMGYQVRQAIGDADTDIVEVALHAADNSRSVTVIANDTDVLLLLLYHYKPTMGDMHMQYETVSKGGVKRTTVSIRQILVEIGDRSAQQVLCAHALSGCDSTSSMFRQGKVKIWRQLIGNKNTQQLTDVIGSPDASHSAVLQAGLQLLTMFYGGKPNDKLNHLRYLRYMDILASSLCPKPERLPPTENAAKFHIYRTHYQVAVWKSLGSTQLKAEEWGWNVIDGCYMPITTDLSPAPDNLMKVIRCKCKIETGRACSSQTCSCRKHGLPCMSACKHCNGEACENVKVQDVDGVDDLDLDDDEPTDHDNNLDDPATSISQLFDEPWLGEEEEVEDC